MVRPMEKGHIETLVIGKLARALKSRESAPDDEHLFAVRYACWPCVELGILFPQRQTVLVKFFTSRSNNNFAAVNSITNRFCSDTEPQ